MKTSLHVLTVASLSPPEASYDQRSHALADLIQQRRAQLIRVAERMTGNYEDAEDVVEEAILKAFGSLSRFRGDAQMGTWLFAIVLNTGRSWLRRRRVAPVSQSLETVHSDGSVARLEFPHPGPSPEEQCVRRELATLLTAEIEKLHPTYKLLLQMCCYGGYSYQEAARVTNSNVPSTKARLSRSKKVLRRRLVAYTGSAPALEARTESVP